MPMAINPAVSPDSSAGSNPFQTMRHFPTIQSMPMAMHVLMMGMKRAKYPPTSLTGRLTRLAKTTTGTPSSA